MKQLQKGQTFKNLRELCNYMGWRYDASLNSYHTYRLSLYYTWHREGHRIVIDEIIKYKSAIPVF